MLKLALPLLAVAVLAACEAPVTTTAPAAPAAANAMPFAGNWNCEGQTFTFTNQTYQPGPAAKPMRMSEIENYGGGTFGLSFPNGYAIGLMDVTATSMTWSSPQTGDVFECRKLS